MPISHFGLRNHGANTKLAQLYCIFLVKDSVTAIHHSGAGDSNVVSLGSTSVWAVRKGVLSSLVKYFPNSENMEERFSFDASYYLEDCFPVLYTMT